MKTPRGEILEYAQRLTEGARNSSYGEPEPNLRCYAGLVTEYLNGKFGNGNGTLNAVDGAVFMILAKISRVAVNQHHADNYVDMAAYAAIAGECAEIIEKRKAVVEVEEGVCDGF